MKNTKRQSVTVLMPVYNTGRYVATAVESILNQNFKEFEFIIIDDGSTDRSYKVLKGYENRDSRIRLISRENLGISKTRNELIGEANGDLLLWADSDDISYPNRIDCLLDKFLTDDKLIWVSSSFCIVDPSGMPIRIMSNFGNFGIGTAMISKRAAMVIGGFRENLPIGEDTDFGLRMREFGKMSYIDCPLLDYRQHFGSICNSLRLAENSYVELIKNLSEKRRLEKVDVLKCEYNFNQAIPAEAHKPEPAWQTHSRWAWWALGAGNIKTARKHSFIAVVKNPLNTQTWKVFLCSLRGH